MTLKKKTLRRFRRTLPSDVPYFLEQKVIAKRGENIERGRGNLNLMASYKKLVNRYRNDHFKRQPTRAQSAGTYVLVLYCTHQRNVYVELKNRPIMHINAKRKQKGCYEQSKITFPNFIF